MTKSMGLSDALKEVEKTETLASKLSPFSDRIYVNRAVGDDDFFITCGKSLYDQIQKMIKEAKKSERINNS